MGVSVKDGHINKRDQHISEDCLHYANVWNEIKMMSLGDYHVFLLKNRCFVIDWSISKVH